MQELRNKYMYDVNYYKNLTIYFRFAFTIGNILDATVNKPNSTVTPDTF